MQEVICTIVHEVLGISHGVQNAKFKHFFTHIFDNCVAAPADGDDNMPRQTPTYLILDQTSSNYNENNDKFILLFVAQMVKSVR